MVPDGAAAGLQATLLARARLGQWKQRASRSSQTVVAASFAFVADSGRGRRILARARLGQWKQRALRSSQTVVAGGALELVETKTARVRISS